MMLNGDALMLLRRVALALSHGAAHNLPLSPGEQRRLAKDVADAIRTLAPALRTLDAIVADAADDDRARMAAQPCNVLPFGGHR